MNFSKTSFGLSIILSFFACKNEVATNNSKSTFVKIPESKNKFDDYWYQGLAEISSYQLEQARYGEIHEGEAVLIFVTEDFSASKQVKLDNPSTSPKDAIKILKLNATRKFNTGIYPYSMMNSIFTPIDLNRYPNSLKLTTTAQDWCGHSFMQVNLDKNNYKIALNSYFESEGDQNYKVEKVLLEDEIWNLIRIAPNALPEGEIMLLPSTFHTRFRHTNFKPESAIATLQENVDDPNLMDYNIKYNNLDRSLKISFQKDFPFQIEAWEETNISGWGTGAKKLTTKAVRKKSMMLDYWKKNNNEDLILRKDLELSN